MTIAASASELRAALGEEREATGKQPTKRAFADFHIHTRFSRDSILSEEKFIEKAIERGLTHVCVTNHNNVEGAVAVRDKVAELGLTDKLTVILGEEVSTADGEVVGVFLDEDDPPRPQRQRDGRRDPPAGRAGEHPAPVRPVPRLAHQGGAAAQPRRDRQDRHGRGLQLPGDAPAPQPGGRRVRGPIRHPGHRRLRLPLRASRSRWPSTRCPPFETAEELKALLPENEWHASRSTRLHPRDHALGGLEEHVRRMARQADRHRSHPRAREARSRSARSPSSGRRERSFPTRSPSRATTARPTIDDDGAERRSRGDQPRPGLAPPPAAQRAHHRLAALRPAAHLLPGSRHLRRQLRLGRGRAARRPGGPRIPGPRLRHVLRDLPAAGLPLAVHPGAQRDVDRLPRRHRDPVPVVVRQLPGSRPSWATCIGPSCCARTTERRSRGRWAPCSSSGSRTSSSSPCWR